MVYAIESFDVSEEESDHKSGEIVKPESEQIIDEHQYWKNLVREYFLGLDGLFHVVKTKNKVIGAFLLLVFCSMCGIAGWVIDINFRTWEKSPVVNSVEQININQVLFPAITICPMDDDK